MCVDGHLITILKVCTRIPIIRANLEEQPSNESFVTCRVLHPGAPYHSLQGARCVT